MTSKGVRRLRRWLVGVLAVLAVSALLFEGALRFLVLSETARVWPLARELRRPERFAGVADGDLYWQLQWLFLDPQRRGKVPWYDAELGWVGFRVEQGTYRHTRQDEADPRRPILLYGDSFAQCQTLPQECFEGLVDELPLGERFQLVNYGVGGYGLDQIQLLFQRSIEAWVAREPIVLIGILVDDDLDRCALSFRCWPKPRLSLVDGRVVSDGPVPESPEAYMRAHAPLSRSLAWLLARRAFQRLPWRTTRTDAELRVENPPGLSAALLEAMVARLTALELSYCFVLFHEKPSVVDPEQTDWRLPLIVQTLDRLGAPYVSTADAMRAETARRDEWAGKYFGGVLGLDGHFNALGNQIAMVALLDGLERHCGVAVSQADRDALAALRGQRVLHARNLARTHLNGLSALVRYQRGLYPPFVDPVDIERYVVRVGEDGPTEVEWELDGRAEYFTAMVGRVSLGDQDGVSDRVTVSAIVDGELCWQKTLAQDCAREPLSLELLGKRLLVLRVDDGGDGPAGDTIVLGAPQLR